ncbi:MAG: type II toxin-antitoxin system RelE/ParE family toxin [bacterium]
MEIKFKKTFMKDLESLPKNIRKKVENFVFVKLAEISSITELKNLKKIKGFDKFYRFRIGDYRIGLEFKDSIMILYRVLHRKNIYKRFP